jgi:hypothetical protein
MSSPGLAPAFKVRNGKRVWIFFLFKNRLSLFRQRFNFEGISRDKDVVSAYENDP